MSDKATTDDAAISEAIVSLTAARGPNGSICPSEAARALMPAGAWQVLLPAVRRVAVILAKANRVVITRKGKPVDPEAFKGVYRLRQPAEAPAETDGA